MDLFYIIILLFSCILVASANVQSKNFQMFKQLVLNHQKLEIQKHSLKEYLLLGKIRNPPEQYISQPLDHFDPFIKVSYKQRYWVNNEYWRPSGGPVFLFIGGEGELSSDAVTAGHHVVMAKKYGALLFAVEHRYYGASINDDGLELKNIQYLSSQQALADLAAFHSHVVAQYNLTANNVWICFGGSYPGALSAWFRLKYPHLVYGAVASSAPVRAKTNFQGYNEVVGASLSDPVVHGSRKCFMAVKAAFSTIDALFNQRQYRKLENDFLSCNRLKDAYDVNQFVSNLAGIFMGVIQYNNIIPGTNAASICREMTMPGIPYRNLIRLNKKFLNSTDQTCADNSWQNFLNELRNTTVDRVSADRQWIYQTCTQFGYYQSCDNNTGCPFSYRMNLQPNLDMCSKVFAIPSWTVDKLVQFTNQYYGANHPRGMRIIFVNGSIDPWHALSVLVDETTSEIAIYINGTAHCANMHVSRSSDPPSLIQARVEVSARIGHWLQDAKFDR